MRRHYLTIKTKVLIVDIRAARSFVNFIRNQIRLAGNLVNCVNRQILRQIIRLEFWQRIVLSVNYNDFRVNQKKQN